VDRTHLLNESLGAIELEGQGCQSSPELVEVSALEVFSLTLQNAQRKASTAEGPRKCQHTSWYQGNSDRTKQRNKKAKRDLEAQGFLSLPDFFKQTAMMAWHQNVQSEGCEDKDKHIEGGTALILVPVSEVEVEVEVEVADTRSMHTSQVNDNNAEDEEEEANKADKRSKCAVQVDGNSKAEEEEEEEEETPMHTLWVEDNDDETEARTEVTSICAPKEEEETKSETSQDAWTARGWTMSAPWLSRGNEGLSCWGWGPSWMILCKSKESLPSLGNSDTPLGNLKELFSIDTKEVEGLHDGNAPDDSTAQQPASNAADLLWDHTRLQRAHGELTLKAKTGGLDPVLCDHIVAMTRDAAVRFREFSLRTLDHTPNHNYRHNRKVSLM
jgi:hypothetical protein